MNQKPQDILAATWSIYRSSGKESSRSNFYDFTLSIIGWQILERDKTIAENGTAHTLEAVAKDTTLLEKALCYWDEVLQQQERTLAIFTPGLLSINPYAIRNISNSSLTNILRKWAAYFARAPKQAPDLFTNLLDYIEQEGGIMEGFFFTPRELSQMMIASIQHGSKNPLSVYDPFARTGDLLTGAVQEWHTIKQVQGGYTRGQGLKLAALRLLCSSGPETEIILNPNPDFPIQAPEQFDIIICNPPYGAKASDEALQQVYNKSLGDLAQKTRRLDVLFLGHILDSLSDNGQAAVLLPAIIISGNSLGKTVIAGLLAQNVLDMVVELPPGLFTHTGIAPVLLCLSKTRKAHQPVWLVDATAQAQKQGRQYRLNLETMLQWFGQIKAGDTEAIKEITAAKPADIEAHDYNLYQMLHSGDSRWNVSRESSFQLYDQCLKLEQDLAEVQEKMKTLLVNPIQ